MNLVSDWRDPDWKAPGEDGQTLIWPEPADLLRRTRENHQRLSSAHHARVQNAPLPELRRAAREWIGHADDAAPIIASGHQTELYHPGVWAKDVLAHQAAARLGGQAFHFAVDTDSPKHLQLRWPGASLGVTDDPHVMSGAWSGLLSAPTPHYLKQLETEARDAFSRIGFEPLLFPFIDSLRRLSLESPDLPSALTNAQHQLDWSLGLRHGALLLSPILASAPFLALVHHVMSRPAEFAAAYNESLATYRDRTSTRDPMRPMPDLFVSGQSVEAPFWLDDLAAGSRTRPSVFRDAGDRWVLKLVNGAEFGFDPRAGAFDAAASLQKFLTSSSHRLSPRALTLTLFVRLMIADQFVHGIGGARYDRVTDQIIARHFGIEPPHFSVTTATLFFPGASARPRVCLPCMAGEGHRLRHAVLGARKRELLAQIAAAPRRSARRQELFATLHRQRREAAEASTALKQWEHRLRDAERAFQDEQVLFDRELFYATQSRQRLADLIDRYGVAFASSGNG
jgi:hypothetical protein